MLFITSDVEMDDDSELSAEASATSVAGAQYTEAGGAVRIDVARIGGVKCARCWRYVPSVSREREGLCERCADALSEAPAAQGCNPIPST